MKTLIKNKRAFFDYAIDDQLVAGLVLSGAEVKSLKAGQASLAGAYVSLRGGQAFLTHAHITPYKYSTQKDYNPEHDRKLLLNRKEIDALAGTKGKVLIPLEIVENRGLIKLKIGIGHGKKKYDKRESIKKRDVEKRIRQRED